MKSRFLIRIVVTLSVLLLCTAVGVYSYVRLNAVEKRQDFNLYSLVPQDAIAVLETDHLADLVEDINQLHCSKDNHFLYVSELFVYLKKYLHTLVEDTPHGLSKQMNKMLISFHEPDTPMNQVLYCSLGSGDYELVESFVKKYCSSGFPSKLFEYKGEEIRIYPMVDGHFLAAYFTPDFFVLSFQKRLIEQVIDANREKKSLMRVPAFHAMHDNRRDNVAATIYVRMKDVEMGKTSDDIRTPARLGGWAEFDMKLGEDAIYCSGISHEADTTRTFVNALRHQIPIDGFPGEYLPLTTFFYNRWASSDLESVFRFAACQEYAKTSYSDYIKERDEEWIGFLNDYANESVVSCLFHSGDTLNKYPCAVMYVSLKDSQQAERRLRSLLYSTPRENDTLRRTVPLPGYIIHPKGTRTKLYMLPRNTIFTQLTGITESALHTYACFYRGVLFLAPDISSLSSYICALEEGNVLDGTPLYEEGVASLSPVYSFMLMADMEEMLSQPEMYVRLVPNFFFRQAKFFRHFMLAVQFTCADDVVYPNIVLLYKKGYQPFAEEQNAADNTGFPGKE